MRLDLPYAVRVIPSQPTYGRLRDGRERPISVKRYFATRKEALAFCHDESKVLYCPDEAWTERPKA